jgi:hypothetical protein
MPLRRPSPQFDITRAFVLELAAFLSNPGDTSRREGFAGEPPSIPTLADLGPDALLQPVGEQVFVLALNTIAGNANINEATPAGWRFFAGTSPAKTVMGRVSRRQSSLPWRLTGVYYGDRVYAARQASLALEQLDEVRAADYEVRVLSIPGLNLEAFWLTAQNPGPADLVVPFPASPNQKLKILNQKVVYSLPTFLGTIRPLALLQLNAEPAYGS